MCSKEHCDRNQFRIFGPWRFSDSDKEESPDWSVSISSMPDNFHREPKKINLNERARTKRMKGIMRGFSPEGRTERWHRSPVEDAKAKNAANQYSEMVQDDTFKHLSHTVQLADSIAGKGAGINEELRRQERVLRQADADISFAEYETDQTIETLKGMRSLKSKLVSTIRKKKPKLKVQIFSDFDLLNRETGLSSVNRMLSPQPKPLYDRSWKDTKQQQIHGAMGELNAALDVVKVQQMDVAWALNRQEKYLAVFGNKLDSTHTKINQQRHIISSIISKS